MEQISVDEFERLEKLHCRMLWGIRKEVDRYLKEILESLFTTNEVPEY